MKNRTLKWLYQVPGQKRAYVLVLALLHALLGVTGVVYAMLMRSIVDSASAGDSAAFWRYVAAVIAVVLAQLGVNALNRWLYERFRSDIENTFKQRLFHEILNRDYARVSAVHSGEWLNRLTNDTAVVANAYTEILPGLTGMLIQLASALVMIVALDLRFAVILLPAGLAILVLATLFRRRLKQLHKNVQEMDGRLRIFFQERIGSMMVLHAFAAEKKAEREAEQRMETHREARLKKNRFSNVCSIGFGAAMNAMYFLGVIYCGYGILKGRISFGTLTAITMLISQIQSPFANISAYLPRYYMMLASAERLMEIESFEADGEGELLERETVTARYRDSLAAFGLCEARFAYYPTTGEDGARPGEKLPPVFESLSICVRKGEVVAFTGQSGCGKSTALKLFMCIYPLDAGRRFLLFTDGSERELDAGWRRLFAYVPQGNALMSGTIRQVVSFADPDRSGDDATIWQALKIACADGFTAELENGIDTPLGERGAGLSEGQMQRIAIARAIFSESPVLLLDEATSALDEETETRLLQNLRLMTDRTVVIVTHRPAALSICDRILHFTENGVETLADSAESAEQTIG